MNCSKNSRPILSLLLRRTPAVVHTTPRPLRPRCFHTFRILRDRITHRSPQSTHRRFQHTAGPQSNEITRWTSRRGGSRWYEDDRVQAAAAAAVLVAGGGAVAAFFCRREVVPYTNRTRLILLTPNAERWLGEFVFNKEKRKLDSKILSPLDPDSVRVRRIATEIVGAVHRGLASRQCLDASSDDGALSQNRGKPRGAQINLDGLDWELIVVKDKMVNASCAPGGKIIVYTGLLDKFREDAEIATVLGHEVGHAIARHFAEMLTTYSWFVILQIIILQFINVPDGVVDAASKYFLVLPISRRMEMEADHVGLMLLAAAGYDPRVAPSVYEKLGNIGGDSELRSYISTHPSSKKRSQLLSQQHVMNEALELYLQVISTGQGTEGSPLDSGTQVKYGKGISAT